MLVKLTPKFLFFFETLFWDSNTFWDADGQKDEDLF